MTYFVKCFLVFVLLVLNSCVTKENTDHTSIQKENEDQLTNVIQVTARKKITANLSKEVQQLAEENTSFSDLKSQIEKINTMRVKDFSSEMESIQENCKELLKTMPKAFRSKSINSRIDAIKTFAKAIAFEKKKGYTDTIKRYNYSMYLVESYNSLIIQLNDSNNELPETVKKSLEQTLEIKKDTIVGEPLF